VKQNPVDLIFISMALTEVDGLRLATQFKAMEALRHVPIVMLVEEDDQKIMLKALELGVNDYLVVPVDYNEMLARVKTQIRRKKYQDALKSNYQESVSMAITDGLTGLYNRHYLDTHLSNMVQSSLKNGKAMSLIIMDMDHFKSVNDTYGHDVGDEVLKQLAKIIIQSTRSADLAARFGGEEFVILMPETPFKHAREVSDRIRKKVETTPFKVSHEAGEITRTLSIGVSSLNMEQDSPDFLLKRADTALYQAKNSGRNRVCPLDEEEAADLAEALQAVAGSKMMTAAEQQGSDHPKASTQPAAPVEFTYDTNTSFMPVHPVSGGQDHGKSSVVFEVVKQTASSEE